jgi:hypothetical protein
MPKKTFKLSATVSSGHPAAVRPPLERVLGPKAKIVRTEEGSRSTRRSPGTAPRS